MTEDNILDDLEEKSIKEVQESLEYRILLTVLWGGWGIWLFYGEQTILDSILSCLGLLPVVTYKMSSNYTNFLFGTLGIGIALIIFRQSKNRIPYLFSFMGIVLLIPLCSLIQQGKTLVFLPIVVLLFVSNLRTCLICYALSLLLFILDSGSVWENLKFLFTYHRFLIVLILIFMSIFPYRRMLFPLKEVIIKLHYRLALLLSFAHFFFLYYL